MLKGTRTHSEESKFNRALATRGRTISRAPEGRICVPCLWMALPVGVAFFLLFWGFGLMATPDSGRLIVIFYLLAYMLLHFLHDAGEYGDGPKTTVALTPRFLVYQEYDSDEYERVELANVRAASVQRMGGRALTLFIRVEHSEKASGIRAFIDFVPSPSYHFDAQEGNSLCDEIMAMADAARTRMHGPEHPQECIGNADHPPSCGGD